MIDFKDLDKLILFHKVDDSCRHEMPNPEYEIIITQRFKHTWEVQEARKKLIEVIKRGLDELR